MRYGWWISKLFINWATVLVLYWKWQQLECFPIIRRRRWDSTVLASNLFISIKQWEARSYSIKYHRLYCSVNNTVLFPQIIQLAPELTRTSFGNWRTILRPLSFDWIIILITCSMHCFPTSTFVNMRYHVRTLHVIILSKKWFNFLHIFLMKPIDGVEKFLAMYAITVWFIQETRGFLIQKFGIRKLVNTALIVSLIRRG